MSANIFVNAVGQANGEGDPQGVNVGPFGMGVGGTGIRRAESFDSQSAQHGSKAARTAVIRETSGGLSGGDDERGGINACAERE